MKAVASAKTPLLLNISSVITSLAAKLPLGNYQICDRRLSAALGGTGGIQHPFGTAWIPCHG